jgi:hypothetical protein
MKTLALVPPAVRPPTLDFPVKLASAVGLDGVVPPPAALPKLNQPGDASALAAWLLERAAAADVLILSLETLCLGGMIPARRVNTPLEDALARLELLIKLKRLKPALRILAFGVIVRVAHGNDPFEEKPYYGEYGDGLRAYSEAFDRHARHGQEEDRRRLEEAQASVPRELLDDWLATRARNHRLHLRALELARQGAIDHLCLTLDDTSTYGLAAHDRRALEAETDALGLWPKVDIYPGADEVPVTLLARAVQPESSRVYVRYSGTLGAQAGTIFEDRPMGELVKAHLRATRCLQAGSLAEADLVLAVNTPGTRQVERQPDYATVDTVKRHLPEFVDFVARCLDEGRRVSLADVAYPNGAERRLVEVLEPSVLLARLCGFSAWNTAGNTLGSAIAMGVLAPLVTNRVAWIEALFGRLVDDYLYQARVRPEVERALGDPSPFDLGEQTPLAEALIEERIRPLSLDFWERHFRETGFELVWERAQLAWPRLFTGVFPFRVRVKVRAP